MERAHGNVTMFRFSDAVPTDRPSLRVVTHDGSLVTPPGSLTPRTTLSRFFKTYGRQCLADRGASRANVAQYEESVRLWGEATGDPQLQWIRRGTIVEFRNYLAGRPGRASARVSQNTVRKHLIAIKAVLRWAGPRGSATPEAYSKRGLFGVDEDGDPRLPPPIKLPPAQSKTPDPLSLENIARWMRACDVARVPKLTGVTPGDWWRGLIAFSYNVGTRINTTLAIEWSMVRGNWLVIPADDVKGRRGELRIWFNAAARQAAEAVRTDHRRLFPWPHTPQHVINVQARIIAASEIPEEEAYGGTHRLRKALATWLTARNPAVARMQLGHSLAGDVLLAHYADPAIIGRLMERVPQPHCDWPPKADDRQMLLF